MIHEYAIDPALVARWGDGATWAFYDGKFGLGTPRAACLLPDAHWRERVNEALEAVLAALPDDTARQHMRKNVEARVTRLMGEGGTRRAGLADPSRPWWEHLAHEHGRRPLEVVAHAPSAKGRTPTLIHGKFNEVPGSRWVKARGTHERTAAGVVGALAPLLRCAREVRMVDPYFNPYKTSYGEALRGVLAEAWSGRSETERPRVELHTALELRAKCSAPGGGVVYEDWRRAQDADGAPTTPGAAERALAAWIERGVRGTTRAWPAGARVEVFLWRRKEEVPHNRYLLTELGGVLLGAGFDKGEAKATDDAALLSREQYQRRWGLYCDGSAGLDPVGRFVVGA